MKVLALAFVLSVLAPGAEPRQVRVEAHVFPGLERMDGNWAALYAASDGKVYAGLAYHGGDGHLVYFDSNTGVMHDIGNLTELAGESALRRGPQSKVHAKFGEGKDGRIYFGTHAGLWWEYARFATKQGYPGAHWMAYDPKTRKVEDFGLGVPNEGVNTGAYDPQFNRIYGLTHPRGHFVYYDVATRRAVDKGRINNWESICRTLGIDDHGYVYGTFGEGRVFRYDPRSDEIRELNVRIPIRPKGISLGRDYYKSETGWRTVVWEARTRQFYGVDESATILFSFNPSAGEDGEMKRLGELSIPEFRGRRDVPYATLSLALGRDRKLYYGAAGREFDYGGSAGAAASHIMTYDLNTGRTDDLGEMVLSDGRIVLGTNAADVGADGTIYFMGAIEVRPEKGKPVEAAGKVGDTWYRLALLTYRPLQ
jgi:outer membrane protein assembly factor BamB